MNWWADKLGGGGPSVPVQRQAPQQVPQAPPGYVLVPAHQVQQTQQTLPYQVQAPPGFKEPPRPQYDPRDPNRPVTWEELQALGVPPGSSQELIRFAVAAARTGGSRNVKTYEQEPCPNCGSHLYFTRMHPALAKTNTETGQRANPSPRCESCGYNGLFEQHGTSGTPGEVVGSAGDY